MHLSRFSTIAICARIFILRPPVPAGGDPRAAAVDPASGESSAALSNQLTSLIFRTINEFVAVGADRAVGS